LIGMVTTSAAARMAPFNGRSPLFGTNPICFSAPLSGGRAFVLDMATSQISYSQIKYYRQQGLQLPVGWALDEDGEPTSHPERVFALSPLGGYKGQGLAMLVQILSCLLPAMPLDHELEHLDTGSFKRGRQIGHFFLAIDPGRFVEPGMFLQSLEQLLHGVRGAPARKGQQVLVAGDPQQSCLQTRRELGIPLNADEERAFLTEESLCRAAGCLPSLSEEAL
jgi:LDH2 family malate/lactate/ureidoglycolate dehydrogenase